MYKKLMLTLLCGVLLIPLRGQISHGYFDRFTSEDGLSENHVNCIHQDASGFMWFGTFDGLNRFDGYEVVTYKPDPNNEASISGLLIYTLTGDLEGNIWVGTTGTGLNRFDPNTEKFLRIGHEPNRPASLLSDVIQSVLVDRQNRLWVGTDQGVSVIDLKEWKPEEPPVFKHFFSGGESGTNRRVNSIFEASDGQVWFGTDAGLFRSGNSYTASLEIELVIVTTANPRPSINTISELPNGQLLIGGSAGLFQQNTAREENNFTRIRPGAINNLAIDSSGNYLWAGTRQGLEVYQASKTNGQLREVASFRSKPQDRHSLSNNTIDDIFVDRSGLVWVGTFGGGVNRYDPARKPFKQLESESEPATLTSNSIRAIHQTKDGRVWVGTVGGGVVVSDGPLRPGQEVAFTELALPQRIYSFMEVENELGHFLYGGSDTGPGLYEIDLSKPNLSSTPRRDFPTAVFTMIEDSRGYLWLGTYSGGLHRWVPDPQEATGYKKTVFQANGHEGELPSDIIRSLQEDRRGNIWVGTGNGLAFLKTSEKEKANPYFTVFKNIPGDKNSLSHNYILPLHESRDGTIWIGTFGGGLNRFLPADEGSPARFEQIMEKDGLPNGVIKSILEDDQGHLWVASNKGIMKYDPDAGSLIAFDNGDGLNSNEFQELAACRQRNGLMIFGGVNGLDLFYPEDIEVNQLLAKPVLTNLEVGNEPVLPGAVLNNRVLLPKRLTDMGHLELKHSENSITIEFSTIQYATPEKNRFAYKLEGFNDEWVYTDADNRRATYTNLPYDDFTFLLKAANNDGIWNEVPAKLSISIEPPFFLKWYAYLFYGLLFLAMLYGYRRYSLIDVEEKNRLMIEEVSREKIQELNQLKLQFFTNISHEFRTPLTLITGPLETMMKSSGKLTSLQQENYQHLMYKNAKYLLRLVNQLLDFRKLDQGQMPLQVGKRDIVDFIREVTAPFEFMANKKDVDFKLEIDEEPITMWFDPDVMEKVIYNLLANAFKFVPQNGRVAVSVYKQSADERFTSDEFAKYGSVVVSVRDNGPGIPRNQLKRIFNRFYKNASDKALNREGAGIGLAYTKSLLDLHHGRIDVESKVGEGTVFYVRLALDKAKYSKNQIQIKTSGSYLPSLDPVDYLLPETKAPESDGATANVALAPGAYFIRQEDEESPLLLYIDDNADLRDFIRTSLSADFRVIAADGGAAGLEIARTSLPDIIISDVMMPEVDGIQVLRELKEDPQTSHIPIIMLSAKSTLEAKAEGLTYGADGYVTKPFNIELLRQQIVNIVQRREVLRDKFRREVITSPKEVTVTNADEEFLKRAMDIVEENMSNTDFSVEQLVKEMRVSRSKLYLKLKALTGQSSSEFVRTVRLKRAVQLLESSGYSVKEVMFMTGFNTASYFSKCFRQQFGIVPSEYVKSRKHQVSQEEI